MQCLLASRLTHMWRLPILETFYFSGNLHIESKQAYSVYSASAFKLRWPFMINLTTACIPKILFAMLFSHTCILSPHSIRRELIWSRKIYLLNWPDFTCTNKVVRLKKYIILFSHAWMNFLLYFSEIIKWARPILLNTNGLKPNSVDWWMMGWKEMGHLNFLNTNGHLNC